MTESDETPSAPGAPGASGDQPTGEPVGDAAPPDVGGAPEPGPAPSWTTPAAPSTWTPAEPAATAPSWPPADPATPPTPAPSWSAQAGPDPTVPNAVPASPTDPTIPTDAWTPEPPTTPMPTAQPTPAAAAWPPQTYAQDPNQAWPPQTAPSWPPQGTASPPPGAPPGGGWGGPPGPPWQGGWQPQQQHAPMSPAKRALAAVAALVLVLASAGVGAGIAIAVHKDPTSRSSFTFPGDGGNSAPIGGNGRSNPGGSSSSGSLDMNAIASAVSPALVNINTTLSDGRAAGTGIVISSNGEVLTNNHVIADATSIRVDIGGTGDTHTAKVIGYDVADDVALVQIDGVSNLKTVTFGDPSKVNVGDPVVAIGNALGQGGTPKVSQGKVTALDQQVTAGDPTGGTTETLNGMIQIDAPIQPGDSGGALVNSAGQVIGMNTAAAGGRFTQQTGSNIGFAIPVDHAITVIRQIQSGNGSDRVHIGSSRALLGVNVADANSGDTNCSTDQTRGALVVGVQGNSAASAAGIQECDTITSLNGKSIADQNALHLALTAYSPGQKVSVGWVDTTGGNHNADVTLGSGPPA